MIRRPLAAVLLVLYALIVARLTLADPSAGHWAFALGDGVADHMSSGQLDTTETELLANVVLFVPIGVLLSVLLGRPLLAVALGVLASMLIELAQQAFLPTRVATFADVWHNGLGALAGALVAWPLSRRPVVEQGPRAKPETPPLETRQPHLRGQSSGTSRSLVSTDVPSANAPVTARPPRVGTTSARPPRVGSTSARPPRAA